MATKVTSITLHPSVTAHSGQTIGVLPGDREVFDHFAEIGDVLTLTVEGINTATGDQTDVTYQWQSLVGVVNGEGVYINEFVDVSGEILTTIDITVTEDLFEVPYRCVIGLTGYPVENGNTSNAITLKRDVANGPTFFYGPTNVKAVPGETVSVILGVTQNTGGRYHVYSTDVDSIVAPSGVGVRPYNPGNPTGRIGRGNSFIDTQYLVVAETIPVDADLSTPISTLGFELEDQYGTTKTEFTVALEDSVRVLTVGQNPTAGAQIGFAQDPFSSIPDFGGLDFTNAPGGNQIVQLVCHNINNTVGFNTVLGINYAPTITLTEGDTAQTAVLVFNPSTFQYTAEGADLFVAAVEAARVGAGTIEITFS